MTARLGMFAKMAEIANSRVDALSVDKMKQGE
jgi:hypothetical protein